MKVLPKNFPFYDWVPKPLGILFLLLLFIPIMTVSGVYSANSAETIGGLGIQSEHITFVGFATSVGMAAFSPFFYQLVCIRRQKLMLIIGFCLLMVLSLFCANTDSIYLLAFCSLVMGFVRQALLMCNLFTLIKYAFGIEATINLTPGNEPKDEEGWDKLDREKTASQPLIYFIFMIIGQLGTWITAWFAYNYEWQYVYYAMFLGMGLAVLICLVTMPYNPYPDGKIPITWSKFGNVTVFSLMCLSFTYIMVYGKVLDWYDSPNIQWATMMCISCVGLFIWQENTRENPYFILRVFRLKSVQGAILLFFGLMVLNSSQMFVNIFCSLGMKMDNLQVNELGNWVLVGYFIGLVTAIIFSKTGWHFKYIFALGFLLIGAYAIFMYFEVQTEGLLSRMKWPIIIRGAGMMMLYAVIAVYANQRMSLRFMSTWVCVMLTVRMIIAPSIGAALYSNVLQERQQHYITRFAQNYDRTDYVTTQQYQQTIMGMKMQGKSETEAENMAAMSVKGKVQVQATLTAVKEMAGWTFYACVVCAGLVLAVPWTKRKIKPEIVETKV